MADVTSCENVLNNGHFQSWKRALNFVPLHLRNSRQPSASFAESNLERLSGYTRSHGNTGRIFDRLKYLSGHFVQTEQFDILLFSHGPDEPGGIFNFVRGFTICPSTI